MRPPGWPRRRTCSTRFDFGDERIAFGAAVTSPLLVGAAARAQGLTLAESGVALCLAALVTSGLTAALDDGRWRRPLAAATAVAALAGLLLASADARTASSALLVDGGVLLLVGLVLESAWIANAAGLVITAGVGGHLRLVGVDAIEPYVAPVAVQLLVVGTVLLRRHQVSSWLAHGPAIALLGGSALVERLGGGPGWHALVAGAVGTAAVAAGGWRRLAGPLVLGTALLVGLTVHESLGTVAHVPTWAWLAAAGTVLLGVGVALERTDTSPLEVGRRVSDVLRDQFV